MRRNTRDVRGLGWVVEGNTEGSLFRTDKELGKCWWIWDERSKGMIKTGRLKKRGKIGVKGKGELHVQWNNLKKPFVKQLGVSII